MYQSNKLIYLRHSSILTLPVIGGLLYMVQLGMLKKNLVNLIYIARRENRLRAQIIADLSDRKTIVCQAYKLGRLLAKIKSHIVLDVYTLDLKNMSRSQLYDLMWSLVCCDSVSKRTYMSFKKILPSNYPIHLL